VRVHILTELNESLMFAYTGIEVNDRSSNSFTTLIFNALKPIARAAVEKRTNAVTNETFNYLWALMVAHLWTVRTEDTRLKSESIGNFSQSWDTTKTTKYLAEFEDLLLTIGGKDNMLHVPVPITTKGSVDGLLELE